jgi:serine/threonine-protein kinase
MDITAGLSVLLAGRYELERVLGHGAMAVVYLARDLKHERLVAIKVLRPELAASLGGERFLREIQIAAPLQHPHILPLYDSGAGDGLMYYVMPYVEGESLRDRLNREGQLPLPDALRISREVAEALSYAHSHDVIHRDIKPENVMITGEHAVVADFGIARAVTAAAHQPLTETGLAIGTPAYMSPEQATGATKLDGRSDVYALGCVLYEMLVGEPPFTGPTAQAVIARHVSEHAPSVRVVREAVPEELEEVIDKTLAKTPADRFTSATQLAQTIGALETGEYKRVPARIRQRRRVGIVGVALIVASIVALRLIFPPEPTLERNRIVVYPLVVSGEYQGDRGGGERVALAVGYALESTGLFRWTDGWSLLGVDAREDVRTLSEDDARDLAREQAAGYFIDGRVVPRGDSVDIMLALHDVAADSVVLWSSAAGVPGEDWHLGLLALNELLPEITGERVGVGWLTDHATTAVAHFLQGEQEYRRSHFGLALDHYDRAVAIDSTLAIAALRGAQAASWIREPDRAEALVAVTLAREPMLPAEQILFARGLESYFTGAADTAVWYLREALAHDPEWRDVWMALGEVYHHFLPNESPLDSLAEAAFATARQLDTAFTPPLYHLTEFAILGGDLEAARDMLDRFSRESPDTSLTQQLFLMYDCVARGDEVVDWQRATRETPLAVLRAADALVAAGAQPACGERAFEAVLRHDGPDAGGRRWGAMYGLQSLLVAQGRYDEAGRLLDSAAATGDGTVPPLYVLDAAAGAPLEAQATAYIAERYGRPGEIASPNLWVLGIWHAHLGNAAELEAVADTLAGRAATTDARMDRLLAEATAALAALARADTAEALDRLKALRPSARSGPLAGFPWESLGPERMALAELLFARGELEQAATVAASFDSPAPVSYLLYLPASLSLRLRVAEARGDAAGVEEYRKRLVALGRYDLAGLVP